MGSVLLNNTIETYVTSLAIFLTAVTIYMLFEYIFFSDCAPSPLGAGVNLRKATAS